MSQNDFLVRTKSQSHQDRCRAILEKHPEIAKLIGRNPYTFLVLIFIFILQAGIASLMGYLTFRYWWLSLILAYSIGAFANHSLYIIIHEAAHNLIFKNKHLNRLCLMLPDLISTFPGGGIGFATFHIKHHSNLGEYDMDADLAMYWEARLVKNIWWRKALWLLFFPIFQTQRTFRVKKVRLWHSWMFISVAVILTFDALILFFLGFNALFYLFISTMFGLGLHPLGARWIQEHYTLDPNQETYSYYGILNKLALNMGYHNEHHDFPSIPWNKLPKVKQLAPEFYDNLKFHSSWTKLLFQFIFKPEYSLFSRVVGEGA